MEESEVPLEHLHEQVHHTAEHSRERWFHGWRLACYSRTARPDCRPALGPTRERSDDEPDRSVRQMEPLPNEKY